MQIMTILKTTEKCIFYVLIFMSYKNDKKK